MSKSLHILMVEDNESDILLLQRTLEKGGYKVTCEVVDTPGAMRTALQRKKNWDVITSDHAMPNFSSIDALALAKELSAVTPFIILSGEIDINLAVNLMRSGANDYIQKKEMQLIIPAIERALEEVKLRHNQRKTSEALTESENRFKEVLENSQVASYKRNILTSSYDYFSPVISQITGYTIDEMNSYSLENVFSLFHPDDLAEINRLIGESLSGKNVSAITLEYRFKHKNGNYVWLEDKYSVMRDNEGTPLALIGSVSDISNRKIMEKEIQKEKINLEKAQQIARIGSWEWDMVLNKVEWSKEMYRIYDIDPETYDGNPESLLNVIHPEDLGIFKNSMNDNLADGNSPLLDYRIIRKDGSIHTLHAEGVVEFDQSKTPIFSIGTIQDISERKQAEDLLRESKEKYKKLHESAGVGIGYYSPEGKVISYNRLAAQNMGGNPEDFEGKSIYELFPKEAADLYMGRIQRSVNSDRMHEYEDMVDLPGEPKWFSSTFSRILNSEEHILGVQIASTDITKIKKTEESLLESEELFRTVFESTVAGVSIVGLDGAFFKVNDIFCNILGYTRDELIGKKFFEITFEDDLALSAKIQKDLLSGNIQSSNIEKRYIRRNGEVIWVFVSVSIIYDVNKKPLYFVTYSQNINERKLAEKAVVDSHEQLSRILDNLQDAYFQVDLSGKFIMVNSTAVKTYGYDSKNELIGMLAENLYADKSDRVALLAELQKSDHITDKDLKGLKKDGSIFWVSMNVQFIKNSNGIIIGTEGVVRDITERKRAEKIERENEIRFRRFFDSVPVSISEEDYSKVYDLLENLRNSGVNDLKKYMAEHPDFSIIALRSISIIDVNAESLLLYKSSNKRQLLTSLDVLLPKESYKCFENELLAIWDKKAVFEGDFENKTLDGKKVIVHVIIHFPQTREGFSNILVKKTDITNQKRIEGELKQSEEKFRLAFMTGLDAFSWTSMDDGRLIEINPVFEELFGYSRDELLGKSTIDLGLYKDPKARETMVSQVKTKGIVKDVVTKARRKDGSEFIASISFSSTYQNGNYYLLGVTRDITEGKQAEEKILQLNTELEQRVKDRTVQLEMANKELESFSYTVSHDLRAPLRGIDGFSLALEEDYKDKLDETGAKYLSCIRNETQRMNQLINDLLKLSKLTSMPLRRYDFNLSDLAKKIFNQFIEENPTRKVDIIIHPNLFVNGDPNLLEIVLTNLLSNAIKYSSKVANPEIVIGKEQINGESIFFISDNGVGFNMEYSQRLFEPFQRMHKSSEFEGTGIGLATSKRIVMKHNGKIWAEARVNKGATFYFSLPTE